MMFSRMEAATPSSLGAEFRTVTRRTAMWWLGHPRTRLHKAGSRQRCFDVLFLVLSATERPHWRKFGSFEKTLDDRLGVTKFLLLQGSDAPQRSRERGRYQKADILIVKTPRS